MFLLFGDQLFDPKYFNKFKDQPFLMIEEDSLARHFPYHKMRLTFLLVAQRHFFNELTGQGYKVTRFNLSDKRPYLDKLKDFLHTNNCTEIHCFKKEDKFFRKTLIDFCKKFNIALREYSSPAFLCKDQEFEDYLKKTNKPFMKTFYEQKRKEWNILVDAAGKPIGGKWSFDVENRSKLKKGTIIPNLITLEKDEITKITQDEIKSIFKTHPGLNDDMIYPVKRSDARLWLKHFYEKKLHHFGEFEDAIVKNEPFVFHSLLSPLINCGLLTPREVIDEALKFAAINKPPLNSLEGFIRQIMGWREFIRGIYIFYSEKQESSNFFLHERNLSDRWYSGSTGIEILDNTISKVNRYGYAHHIERLMILSNLMLLCEIHPRKVHHYFSQMFVDSFDWVMGPNIYGMGQFSDGGIFATKPYICGSNYMHKMSDYKRGEWCEVVDALYWTFMEKNKLFFQSNPRLSMLIGNLKKFEGSKMVKMQEIAENFRLHVTS